MVVSAPVLYDEVKGTFVDFSLKAMVESKVSPQHNARFRIPACHRSFATPLYFRIMISNATVAFGRAGEALVLPLLWVIEGNS